jgi:hypothetical protein
MRDGLSGVSCTISYAPYTIMYCYAYVTLPVCGILELPRDVHRALWNTFGFLGDVWDV